MKPYQTSLFIFRRDLRLVDNSGLLSALRASAEVIPLFIIDPHQVGDSNPYRSLNAMAFMYQSLMELDAALKKRGSKLYFLYGNPKEVLEKFLKDNQSIEALFCNHDYTPFAQKRDDELKKLCTKFAINFEGSHDYLLNPPKCILKDDNSSYTIFTAYYNKALKKPVTSIDHYSGRNFKTLSLKTLDNNEIKALLLPVENPTIALRGGRKEGLSLLHKTSHQDNYQDVRDLLNEDTTHLSAHIKFGTVSIREVYHFIKDNLPKPDALIRQLYWRDFFTQIGFHFPHVFKQSFNKKYANLFWENNPSYFKRWCNGTTGFPLVDAGMRQLNQTGYMHNRARMVVASFLIKDLHSDWRLGEKYFAQKLIDYDPAVNNGSWQWVASTGADPQPYLRIFNPWLQQKKYDPECLYIKRWVQELKNSDSKTIYNLHKSTTTINNYPSPLIDHTEERNKALMYYRKI